MIPSHCFNEDHDHVIETYDGMSDEEVHPRDMITGHPVCRHCGRDLIWDLSDGVETYTHLDSQACFLAGPRRTECVLKPRLLDNLHNPSYIFSD